MKILDYLKDNILFLDGATGSFLQNSGMPAGVRPEKWATENSDVIIDIHKKYFDAGSNAVLSCTFGANLLNFDKPELDLIIKSALENVRTAASLSSGRQEKFVAFDLGPTGKLLKPLGNLDFEDAVKIFSESCLIAEKYGADFIFIETMNDGYETKAALLAAKESTSLPVFVSNAYSEDGNLFTGSSPEAMAAMLEGLGADAIGLNCSFGPEQLLPVAEKIVNSASVPVIFKPNAGLPKEENGKTIYDVSAENFAQSVFNAVKLGVNIVGGCCGTTPEYISALKEKIGSFKPTAVDYKTETVVSSKTHSVVFGGKPVIIGERINPTGKKAVKAALTAGDYDYLSGEGISQQKCGAHILDVNCGLPGIDEAKVLPELIYRLQNVTDLPLQIDSSDAAAVENSLRIYNGKPLINSVNGKEESMALIFPLMKKYGGVVIALTLDENGIPDSAEGRLQIAEKILKKAAEYGIDKKNIVFDPLTLTVSADKRAAETTLEAVKLITEKTGCKTTLGVSNVSFGLPEREYLNSVFMASAFSNGLSSAIINPKSDIMMKVYRSFCALNGLDEGFMDYIAGSCANENAVSAVTAVEDTLSQAIKEGRKEKSASLTLELLKNTEPLNIINEHIIPALDEIGKGFEAKKIFLPQLLMSAEAAKSSFEVIKSNAVSSSSESRGKIILATVKGDVHDIGKNIVRLLLENYGFEVIDLGKDVSPEAVMEAYEKYHPLFVGLSALMTTTVPSMEETIKLLKEKYSDAVVVVGGAVLTEDYAEKISADKYCADAMDTVRFALSVSQ